ncbi:Lipid carrier : UDP-N-acetylgalactosaminyltransferase / Alpha-1,3-N-acetylgalactosamine transferase PglA; Putative glycosyltransferase [uncultured Candidatus Thioglobus sp.]|nr:Lipid carrier : UDP-N-acetylgalactosaminyltransferase / Alpha-1,3-N-acetylgalactosamine transferase PglA; Putative glycosyltransferase [uncultured Candidatus Thioglobus sp.]
MNNRLNENDHKCKLVFIVNNAAFFVSHRLPIAIEAQKHGYKVELITGFPSNKKQEESALDQLRKYNITHHKVSFRGSGMNVFVELYGLIQLLFLILKIKPHIMHCASPKGVLYGGIVARIAKTPSVVLAITGMGYGFTHDGDSNYSIKRSIVKSVFNVLMRFVYKHKNKKIIVQNLDDKKIVGSIKSIEKTDIHLIKGSGVDLSFYRNISFLNKQKIVLLPARMLKDKGVVEFYMAAKLLKSKGCSWNFVLAGTADHDNPSAIKKEIILSWVSEGVLEWLGDVDNMPEIYLKTSIVCLPSYREGMPKALLEAAAAGCAVITTDTIGCRESIEPGVTGDLVKVRSYKHLSNTIQALIDDPSRMREYGVNGQRLANNFYDIKIVLNKTMFIYEELRNNANNI